VVIGRSHVRAAEHAVVHEAGDPEGLETWVKPIGEQRARDHRHLTKPFRADASIVESLGATFITRSMPVEEIRNRYTGGRGFDVVFNTVGGAVLDASALVKRLGHVVSALGWGTQALAPLSFQATTYSGVFTLVPLLTGEGRAHHGEILREATLLAEEGQVRPILDSQLYTLEAANEAHAAVRDGTARGKVVVQVAAA
jgi:NADPH:quinone reductase